MTTVASFEVRYSRFLDLEGRAVAALPDFAATPEELVSMYRAMVLTRQFDAKAVALQRTGRMGTYPSSLGQEAVGVGLAAAMRESDVLVPSYRETAAMLWRGVTPVEILLYWGGDERGSDYAGPREDFPVSVPVGTHPLHAVGVAYAFRLRREARAAVAVFGDGASSKGDVYEALNFAGAWRLPVVFVAVNNQWAISVPRARQTAAETIAQKAIAAGIAGEQIDGNDVIAVRHAVSAALEKAYSGGGPTLIEALTYRMTDHTTADDASRYRPPEEVSAHWREDPIARLRAYLTENAAWSKENEEAMIATLDAEIEAAVSTYEATPPQPVGAIFDHLFAELPAALAGQRAAAVAGAAEAAEARQVAEAGDD
ncbi:MAG: pyruvate dehydrogenase (acetyl-transferring) E1 component subunit alpha [Alphaproteobacteria bacterium]